MKALFASLRQLGPTVVLAGVCLAIVAGLAVLPARTWLTQRESTEATETELVIVEAEVAELEAKLDLLKTDDEVERQARENYDLVYPGEESYRILPAAPGVSGRGTGG